VWQRCMCLIICAVVLTMVQRKVISCWVRSCGLQLIIHNLSSTRVGPKLNVEEL